MSLTLSVSCGGLWGWVQ